MIRSHEAEIRTFKLQASRYTLQTPRVPEIVREDQVEQYSVNVRAVPPSFILFSLFSCL